MRLKLISTKTIKPRVHLATLALVSFTLSFIVARAFTYFFPYIVLVSGGLHIHHFWFGIALLAAGGWLGINYNHKEIDMLAAILYGVGGGLIVDEIGLLLTFGDYWSGITWTFFIILLAFVSVLILLGMYRHKVFEEFHEFISKKASLYIAVLLAAIAIAFVAETDNLTITVISTGITIIAVLIVLAHLVLRTKANSPRNPTSNS